MNALNDPHAERIALYAASIPPEGLSPEIVAKLTMRHPSLTPWCHEPRAGNFELVVAETLAVNLDKVHPARLYLMSQELTVLLTHIESGSNPLPHPEVLTEAEKESARRALTRINTVTEEKTAQLVNQIREHSYRREELLRALAHPAISKGAFRSFFNTVCGENIYFSYDEISPEPYVNERDYSWQNISSEPLDIIRFLTSETSKASLTFVDLGCGSGGSLFPFALLTEWRCEGIEIEPQWCEVAQRVAERLRRSDVRITQADLLEHDFSRRDMYYIYSPFREGEMLTQFVERIDNLVHPSSELLVSAYPPLVRALETGSVFRKVKDYGELCMLEASQR